MFTVVLKHNGEENVIKLTYENIWKEIKNIPGAEIIVSNNWFNSLSKVKKNKFVCFVEADCLVNSGYFTSLVGYIKKNPQLGKLGILSTSTAVNNWAVKFFGYNVGNNQSDGIIPNKAKKETSLPFYTSQIAYIPGALIRVSMLKEVLDDVKVNASMEQDLVYLSTLLSLGFWRRNWMVYIAPNSTYCTTEDYVNDIGKFDHGAKDLVGKFVKESV